MANIPLSKINNPIFKAFLDTSTKRKIQERTKLQTKILGKVFKINLMKVKKSVAEYPIYLFLDETTDSCERFAFNIFSDNSMECMREADVNVHKIFKCFKFGNCFSGNHFCLHVPLGWKNLG